jgi:predicted dehydrogenase
MKNVKTLGIGIIGCGIVARFHALALKEIEGVELVACFALDKTSREAFANEYGCIVCDSFEQLLDHSDIHAVSICTPSGAHMDPAIAAAKAGKHVMVEKPIEVNIDKINQMKKACEENGVQLASILPRRFHDGTVKLKEAIEQNRFGQLTLVEASVKWYRTQEYYDSAKWRGTIALDGGGALMNQSIHSIDLLLYFVGEVESVSAFTECLTHDGIEVEDTAVAILKFKNGAKGVIQGSTSCFSKDGHGAEINICGEHGSAFMKDDGFKVWEFSKTMDADREVVMDEKSGSTGAADPNQINFSWHQKNFEDIFDALRENRPVNIDGSEGQKSVELIQAIYLSAQNGGAPVQLPLSVAPVIKPMTRRA